MVDPEIEKDDEIKCNSQRKYFEENEIVINKLEELIAERTCSQQTELAESLDDCALVDLTTHASYQDICAILDQYMEQPYLLDPFLKTIVNLLMTEARRIVECFSTQNASFTSNSIQYYENCKLQSLFQLMYHLCRIRGYKTIIKLLPHGVSDFEPVFRLLQSQDPLNYRTWETRYILLLWLSILCLVPFNLSTIDSSTVIHKQKEVKSLDSEVDSSLASRLMTMCKTYLADSGVISVGAAVCLARFLSRPDMEGEWLRVFLQFANAELSLIMEIYGEGKGDDKSIKDQNSDINHFKVIGIMQCLKHLAKFTSRERHLQLLPIYLETVLNLIRKLTEFSDKSESSKVEIMGSVLLRKLSIKLVQRIGLLFLQPRVLSWQYQRGLRSLEKNMEGRSVPKADLYHRVETVGSDSACDDVLACEEMDEATMCRLEQIIDILLCGLRTRDTLTRWSAAKGIGRVTSRLSYIFADDIVTSVFELFVISESDSAWHGGSLALAELARRGLLLPQRLPKAVECVANALRYDIRRGTHSIGSHVRDAASYACWSFARAYDPAVLSQYIKRTLAPSLLIDCVFDRELNCRRAASAAFQECVGRQGYGVFSSGIEILTHADYFSVSNTRHAFLEVSFFVAQLPEYRYAFLLHLMKFKLMHWDMRIRELASTAVGKIATLDPAFALSNIFPKAIACALTPEEEVFARHGAILAVAALINHLFELPFFIDGESMRRAKEFAITIERNRLFRGRGGEMIRVAVCDMIDAIATTKVNLSYQQVYEYIGILEDCFTSPFVAVRKAAIAAYRTFAMLYAPRIMKAGDAAQIKYLHDLISRYRDQGVIVLDKERIKKIDPSATFTLLNPNVAKRWGYIRAIGASPKDLILPALTTSIDVLIRAADITKQTLEETDAESRVAAVTALVEICSRMRKCDLLEAVEMNRVFKTLIKSIEVDHAVDERGDVGAWIRMEAIRGLAALFLRQDRYDVRRFEIFNGKLVRVRGFGTGILIRSLFTPNNALEEVECIANGRYDNPASCYVQFLPPNFGYYYFSGTGIGRIQYADIEFLDSYSLEASTSQILEGKEIVTDGTIASPIKVAKLDYNDSPQQALKTPLIFVEASIQLMTQQLAAKLDGVRSVAGQALYDVLHPTTTRVDGIPDPDFVRETLFPANLCPDWTTLSECFPMIVNLLDSPSYLASVTFGLISSVGSLTDSVARSSKIALLAWLQRHVDTGDTEKIHQFCNVLLTILRQHYREDTITIPLIRTLSIIIDSNIIHSVVFVIQGTEDSTQFCSLQNKKFAEELYMELKIEVKATKSIQKILAVISLLNGLIPSTAEIQDKAKRSLIMYLGHKYPNIRRIAAEKLYTKILCQEEAINVDADKSEQILKILSETNWDSVMPTVRSAQQDLRQLLNLV